MLTQKQVGIIKHAIADSAHEIRVAGSGGAYVVSAVDDLTGYPFKIYDYAEWMERRRESQEFAQWMAQI